MQDLLICTNTEGIFVRAELQTRAAAEMSAISLRPLGKCDPEEFYTWTNMKIMIIILEINMSEGGMGCGRAGVSAVSSLLTGTALWHSLALGLRAQGLMPKSTRTPEPPGLKSLEDL